MGLIQRIIAVLLGVVFLVGVLIFASLALGVLVAVGLVVWGWLWWRTRGALQSEPRGDGGAVVEGEFRDVTVAEPLEHVDRGR